MYMLDTNTCIYAIQGVRNGKYQHVTRTVSSKLAQGLAISAITLAELEYGVSKSAYPERNAMALLNFLAPFAILPFDNNAAAEFGRIRVELQRKGVPIGPYDMLIAAHASAAEMVLATSNTREFERVSNLQLEDWMFGG